MIDDELDDDEDLLEDEEEGDRYDDGEDGLEGGGAARSFFAHSDVDEDEIDDVLRADRQVCASVWRMFVKDSNNRGIRASSRRSRSAANIKAGWRKHYGLGERGDGAMTMKEAITAAHAKRSSELGRPPTTRELFEAMDPSIAKSANNVGLAASKFGLELTKIAGKNKNADRSVAPPRKRSRAVKPSTVAIVEVAGGTGIGVVPVPPGEIPEGAAKLFREDGDDEAPSPPPEPRESAIVLVGRQVGMSLGGALISLGSMLRRRG